MTTTSRTSTSTSCCGLLADDFMENGDLEEAMDRLLREGYTTEDGDRDRGAARPARAHAPSAARTRATGRPRRRARSATATGSSCIEAMEQRRSRALLAEAEASGDERRLRRSRATSSIRRTHAARPDERPARRAAGGVPELRVRLLARPASSSSSCMAELERDVLDTYFESNKEFMGRPDPEELARMRDMMDALSTMIEQDRRGEDARPVLRGLHGAVRRLLSRCGEPRGRDRDDGRARRRRRSDVQLALLRAAGRAARAVRSDDAEHGAQLLPEPARGEPARGDARPRLESRAPDARPGRLVLRRGRLGRRAARPAEGARGVPRTGQRRPGSARGGRRGRSPKPRRRRRRATSSGSRARCRS